MGKANIASQKIILSVDASVKSEAEKLTELAAKAGAKYVKFGLELSSATSWEFCSQLAKKFGLDWVADAKLDDIPNTVEKSVLNLKNLSFSPFGITMHTTAGHESMMAAQIAAGNIKMLGVTVLTSISDNEVKTIYKDTTTAKVLQLAKMAKASGLKGIVASPREVGAIKQDPQTKDLFAMIPGSRSASANTDDQVRTDTPAATIRYGADLLVIGRQITQADNPAEAYQELIKEIEGALNGS